MNVRSKKNLRTSASVVQTLQEQVSELKAIVAELKRVTPQQVVLQHRELPFPEDPILAQERFEPTEWARPVPEQILHLQKYLDDPKFVVDAKYVASRMLEPLADRHSRVAVPKLEYLARRHALENPYSKIGVLIEEVCVFLGEQRTGHFTHYRQGQLLPNRVQVIPALAERRKVFEAQSPGDLLILDVDLGNTYAGWTPRLARSKIAQSPEQLALSSVDLGWIILLNPDRFQRNIDLSVDSVMEEYLSEDRGWVTVLFFYYRGGKLEFGYRWNRRPYFDCGAAIATV